MNECSLITQCYICIVIECNTMKYPKTVIRFLVRYISCFLLIQYLDCPYMGSVTLSA